MKASFQIFPDLQQLYSKAAEEFSCLATESASASGVFNVALSGGSTPRGLYTLLADKNQSFGDRIPWQRTHIFWGDERCVPTDNPESNYRIAWETLLSHVPVSPGNIHRVLTEEHDPAVVAHDYERLVRRHFHLGPGQLPRFDLILLGMGADGHTASLFLDSSALKENEKLVSAVWDAHKKIHRITFTFPVLNNAANIYFMVAGADKAEAVRKALEGGPDSDIPAQGVRPVNGNLLWLLDSAAAGKLRPHVDPSGPIHCANI